MKVIDHICSLVGFENAVRLVAWKGGESFHFPTSADASHPCVRLVGEANWRVLVGGYGGTTIKLPRIAEIGIRAYMTKEDRHRQITMLLPADSHSLAKATGLSYRRVQQILGELRQAKGPLPNGPQKSPPELARHLPQEKAPLTRSQRIAEKREAIVRLTQAARWIPIASSDEDLA